MNRSQQYLFMSLFLLFFMMSFYISFDIYIEGSDYDKKRIYFLSQELEEKKLEIQLAKLNSPSNALLSQRNIASVNTIPPQSAHLASSLSADLSVDLSEFYFMRFEELKKQNKRDEALTMLEKIRKSTANDEHLARADYEYLAMKCSNFKLSEICIDTLDTMVLRYPASDWTGKGLAWLSKTYSLLNRKEEAKQINRIINNDFKQSRFQ